MTKEAQRIGVWGRSGSGKSSLVQKMLEGRKRVIVFDPLEDYTDMMKTVIQHEKGSDLDKVRQAIAADPQGFTISLVPAVGDKTKILSVLCGALKMGQAPYKAGNRGVGIITLVIEEMNETYNVRGGSARCPGLADLCSRGRHYGIELIGVSQRPAEVDTNFRGNCGQHIVFAQGDPTDRDAAARLLWKTKADMPELQDYEYIHKIGTELREYRQKAKS